MRHLEAATMDLLGLLGKCWIVGFIGPLFLDMLINYSPPMNNVKELERPLAEDMRCPSNPFCFVKFLMCGVLTSWGHSQSPMDYVSRWVKAIATKTNNAKVVFGVPKVLISDQGSHFCNRATFSLVHKYGVVHRIATTYHPQTNSQAEVFNREIKKTLQKMTNPNRKD
ncbi:gag-pol, partial [Mucuna pruriens]